MIPSYLKYIELNLAPIRKSLEKRPIPNGLSSEGLKDHRSVLRLNSIVFLLDLLSIPPKQFLQILSQVQVRFANLIELMMIEESLVRIYIKLLKCSNRMIKKVSLDSITMLNDVEPMAYVSSIITRMN